MNDPYDMNLARSSYCNMQYKRNISDANHTFQGHFLHYLVISNRNLEMLMGINNAYCSTEAVLLVRSLNGRME